MPTTLFYKALRLSAGVAQSFTIAPELVRPSCCTWDVHPLSFCLADPNEQARGLLRLIECAVNAVPAPHNSVLLVASRSARVASSCQLDFWHITQPVDAKTTCGSEPWMRALTAVVKGQPVNTRGNEAVEQASQGRPTGFGWWLNSYCVCTHSTQPCAPTGGGTTLSWHRQPQMAPDSGGGAGNCVGSKSAPVERRDSGRVRVGAPAGCSTPPCCALRSYSVGVHTARHHSAKRWCWASGTGNELCARLLACTTIWALHCARHQVQARLASPGGLPGRAA